MTSRELTTEEQKRLNQYVRVFGPSGARPENEIFGPLWDEAREAAIQRWEEAETRLLRHENTLHAVRLFSAANWATKEHLRELALDALAPLPDVEAAGFLAEAKSSLTIEDVRSWRRKLQR